jgi:hypothetical protein
VELYLHSPNTPSWRGAQLKSTEERERENERTKERKELRKSSFIVSM